MHLRVAVVVTPLVLAAVHLGVSASPAPDAFVNVLRRDDDAHHHHAGAPLLVLNETEITMYHEPTPPSYYTADWEDQGYEQRHAGLMIAHGIFMCLAFFVALPIALRSVKHVAHGMATVSFYALCALGCASSGLYRKASPNMYEGAVHGKQSYLIILAAISLSALDIFATSRRIIIFVRSADRSPRAFWRFVIKKEHLGGGPEYSGIVTHEPEEYNSSKLPRDSVELQHIPLTDSDDRSDNSSNETNHHQTEQWAHAVHRHRRRSSAISEGTLFGTDTLHDDLKLGGGSLSQRSYINRIGQVAFAVVERGLVIAGFTQLLVGIVVYTGGCRQNYVNGCLAHLIKGGIFWCYGLLTFARFLGAYADMGWSWNISPSGNKYTAEFVESFIIFIYGATNTWMERFGANPGDPFTTKQIQHISIAVMFCFAGLLGMGIESKRIRKWLSSSTFASLSHRSDISQEAMSEPQSYMGSFNPFPALVIGVTGAAMAAHAQTYLFQVEIHKLWGNLLVAFAVLRCLTYFFLWLGPSRSILPSRPPTEALGSFFLACGGLVFMFSTEEVTIAAMRRGRDDVMMFLNVAVAITCFACCWTLFIVGFKSWIVALSGPPVTDRNPA